MAWDSNPEPQKINILDGLLILSRLPGGTERVINTKSTTVVTDIIEELCNVIGVDSVNEREEFSLYCIVEGETFTVPLAKDHYILDVTTGAEKIPLLGEQQIS